jgi:hypothetical protein
MEHCDKNHQPLSFCGAHAHFQNSIAEKRIRDLQDSARTMLMHAKHHWPRAINAHLWPYALGTANDVHMHAPLRNGKAPLDLFSQIASTSVPKHFHPFGCPVYVLLNVDGKGSKWGERARVGINLSNSPSHACSISLVLNVDTGLVSPQFHVRFDDLFETAPTLKQPITWQQRTGFAKSEEPAPSKPLIPDDYQLPLQATMPTMRVIPQQSQPEIGISTEHGTTTVPPEGTQPNAGDTPAQTQSQ